MVALLITRCGCTRRIEIRAKTEYIVMPLKDTTFGAHECEKNMLPGMVDISRRVFRYQEVCAEFIIYKEEEV